MGQVIGGIFVTSLIAFALVALAMALPTLGVRLEQISSTRGRTEHR